MKLSKPEKEWFAQWFDTEYYHILYKHRDFDEAEKFIKNLVDFLSPAKDAYFLDMACGKGRHAVFLNKLGYKTDAFDLSPNNIKEAKKFENDTLHFYVNDIRKPLKVNTYDYALNLFTSFGYFEDDKEDIKALKAIATALKDKGTLVLDFLNVDNLSIKENEKITQEIDGITFITSKKTEGSFVVKDIEVIDGNRRFTYQERVKLINQDKFNHYFAQAGFKILHTFGNYNLDAFNPEKSERIILVAQKNV
ncbi:MAG TPA: SAM-dependent methyltransferase [Flavobacteriales bacterium]|nr:SAM-dependent methyltransferase [Flavobacteriales bacterium]|tara:strand:- start:21771 stop:22520 length:750 start_codon:yes stop_codon:yes gene_type:complete